MIFDQSNFVEDFGFVQQTLINKDSWIFVFTGFWILEKIHGKTSDFVFLVLDFWIHLIKFD